MEAKFGYEVSVVREDGQREYRAWFYSDEIADQYANLLVQVHNRPVVIRREDRELLFAKHESMMVSD